MTVFGRKFDTDKIEVAVSENTWLGDLLQRWRPAGDALEAPTPDNALRLCVRDGYLNFYRAGQSIAAVRLRKNGKPQAEIHNKYVYGALGKGQKYIKLTAAGYPHQDTNELIVYDATRLDLWISRVNGAQHGAPDTHKGHIGREKRFVDQVVSKNPNVIDLEMAIPAFGPKDERRAPRVDLVALERTNEGWQVVFWEVKRVDDSRARCRGDRPEVVDQLEPFAEWLSDEGNRTLVIDAYRTVCRSLIAFHGHEARRGFKICKLGDGIHAVGAEGAALTVNIVPRILIDDMTKHDPSFSRDGHLDKLRGLGFPVQHVRSETDLMLKAPPCHSP